ncbi:MAG TPA: ABC transporter substrate-binding protein [Acidimicrobiales bacterium]|nr:ABC transporter substrate-binding protein [Acidimicrobiales bacterium]
MRRLFLLLAALVLIANCGTRVPHPVGLSAQQSSNGQATGANGNTADTVVSDGAAADNGTTGDASSAAATNGQSSASGASATQSQTPTGPPIMLGAVGTRSGIIGAAVKDVWRGLPVWEKWVNTHGGIMGRPVKVIIVDDAGDPGKHAAAVRRLIREDKVVAFVGPIAATTLSAGTPILEQAQIPVIGGDSGESGWFKSPMAFPSNSQGIARGNALGKWGAAHLNITKAAVFYLTDVDVGERFRNSFKAAWQKAGKQIVVDAGVSLAQPDFTSEILQAKNAGAEAIFIGLEEAACQRFFDAARRQNYTPIWFSAACVLRPILRAKDITTNRTYGGSSFGRSDADTPAAAEWREAYKRFAPDLPYADSFSFTWISGKMFEAAVKAGGGVTSKQIIDGLHKLKNETLGGLIPPQSWPPGPHPEGSCGRVDKFDGTRYVDISQGFLC